MATAEELVLPTDEKVRFVYLRKWPNLGDMIYLQAIRSGRLKDDSLTAQTYRAMAPTHAARLTEILLGQNVPFDAVVSPPSARGDSAIYRQAFVRRMGVPDFTQQFSRKGLTRAATASSVEEVTEEFIYAPTGDEPKIRSLLIIDESVATGKTVAAVINHLRACGLSDDCSIIVAAAAWLTEKTSRSDVPSEDAAQ